MPALSGRQGGGGTLRVRGYNETIRAFNRADKALKTEMRAAFRDVAEPLRSEAESLAAARITYVGPKWNRMRTAITTNLIYVAPKERGRLSKKNRGLRRSNMADLLMDRAMQPALDRNEADVADRFDEALGRIERIWGAD